MRSKVTILLALGAFISASPQDYLTRLKATKPGEGTVTIAQSKDIDALVNGKPATVPETPRPDKAPASPGRQEATTIHPAPGSTAATPDASADTRKKVIANGQKVTGYRVQVYSGGNSREAKAQANSIGSRMKILFPEQPVYVHFYSPRWICRIGNFTSYHDAEAILKEVKAKGYPQACIVKGKITVQE